mmetsp:Transcript_37307/g.86745  ORF Transcript_37307/g.86745 Transcript_37307/m.86745 type:complete len:103 (+) Transcript_37307:913-1221(+)
MAARTHHEDWRDHLVCAICLDLMQLAHVLSCGHTFCGACIPRWLALQGTCPVCRTRIVERPFPVRALDNVVHIVAPTTPPCSQRLEGWAEQAEQADDPEWWK